MGKLYGTLFKNNLLIIALSLEDENNIDLTYSFPTEVDFCGIVNIHQGGASKKPQINKKLKDVDVTDNPIYLDCKIGNANEIVANFVVNERLQAITFEEISEHEIYSQFVHVRLRARLPFVCELTQESVRDTTLALRKLLTSGIMAFTFPKTNIYLMGNDNENSIIGLAGDPTVAELCDQSTELNEGCARKKKSQNCEMTVIDVDMFKRMTVEGQSVFTKEHAPIFVLDKRK